MFKLLIFVCGFLVYANADYINLAPILREKYRGSGLTDKEIIDDLQKTSIVAKDNPLEPLEFDLDFDIEEILRSVKKRAAEETKSERYWKVFCRNRRYQAPFGFGWCL